MAKTQGWDKAEKTTWKTERKRLRSGHGIDPWRWHAKNPERKLCEAAPRSWCRKPTRRQTKSPETGLD